MLSIASEKGQGLVEYALIIILIAVVLVGAVTAFGGKLDETYNYIKSQIPDA